MAAKAYRYLVNLPGVCQHVELAVKEKSCLVVAATLLALLVTRLGSAGDGPARRQFSRKSSRNLRPR